MLYYFLCDFFLYIGTAKGKSINGTKNGLFFCMRFILQFVHIIGNSALISRIYNLVTKNLNNV